MIRQILGKTAVFSFVTIFIALSSTDSRGGWFSRNQKGDCDGGMTACQIKALTAAELARARKLSDLSCAELNRIAEHDRHIDNLRALANYHRSTVRAAFPSR